MRDYYLFLELILATDNHGKNMLFYVYDKQGPEGGKLPLLLGTWMVHLVNAGMVQHQ